MAILKQDEAGTPAPEIVPLDASLSSLFIASDVIK